MYFQAITKGRRQKCGIPCIWEGDNLLEHQDDISSHIYSFYMELFTAEPRGEEVSLAEGFWPSEERVSNNENEELLLPLSQEEVGRAISSMKAGSAPGPDGIPVASINS